MTPRTSKPADTTAAHVSAERVDIELGLTLRRQTRTAARLVIVGPVGLTALALTLMWGQVDRAFLLAWIAAILVPTLIRAIWQARAERPGLTDRQYAAGLRTLVLVQALVWGVGLAILLPELPFVHVAMLVIGFSGVVSSATNTLVADRLSIRLLVAGMYLPPMAQLFAISGRDHVITAVLMALFIGATLLLHRRARRELLHHLHLTLALTDSEARFRRVVESDILGVTFWDADGQVSEANDELLRILGFTREDLVAGRVNWLTLTPPEYAEGDRRANQAVRAGETCPPWEKELFRKDGSRVAVLIGVAPFAGAGNQGVAFVVDISQRKQAEAKASWRAALLEAQIHSAADGILVVDGTGRKVLQNQRFAELMGIPREVAEDTDDTASLRYATSLARDPEGFLARVQYLHAHPDEVAREEVEFADGRVLDLYTGPMRGDDGARYGRIWTIRDVTERRRAAEAMVAARDLAERAAETRSLFLANMSHEIRTPMNAVLGMVEIVLDSDLSGEQRHALELVRTSAESLLGVLNDILDYSKIEADHLDLESIPFDLPRLVHTTTSLMAVRAREKDLEMLADIGAEVPAAVRGDPSRLRQVLGNLLGNAVKFTERGEVVVSVAAAALEDGRPGVRFAVRDSGIGIAPDRLGHIFEEFTQADGSTSRRYGGTGLGLTIAQRLVGLMGGRITVTSEPGRGSEFAFTLPVVATDTRMARPASPVSLTGRRVVVVDDNATNRRILREMLRAEGARVDEAADADSGLGVLRRGPVPALAIIDVRMAGGDGFELAAAIRRDPALAALPLLMLTSAGQRGDAARCRELGIAGYLTKPIARGDLLEGLALVLGDAAAEPERQLVTRHSLTELRQPLRVLLAEDNPVNQEVAATMLRRRGHKVETAGNGREAVAAVERDRFDVVLMDIQMPELDGFEATAAIRALGARGRLPIIALTAHALSGERERCIARGMDGYLAKPFKTHDLFAAVEGWGIATGAQAALAAAPPAVDLDLLRDQLRETGAEDALDLIVDTFLDSVPERLVRLAEALVGGTQYEVADAAHALKSSAGAIGAGPLARLLAEIEQAGRTETLGDRQRLADQVHASATVVLADLRNYRGKAA